MNLLAARLSCLGQAKTRGFALPGFSGFALVEVLITLLLLRAGVQGEGWEPV